ncbi:polyketide synthase dehydratase domain-containing protein [Streptomyces sp. M19]
MLTAMAQDCVSEGVVAVPTLRRDSGEERELVGALARLYGAGVAVDWSAFFAAHGARRVDLPTYPFQRTRLWLEATGNSGDASGLGQISAGHPLLGALAELPDSDGLLLTGRLSLSAQPWLGHHVVLGTVLLPGTAFVEMAVQAGDKAGCDTVEELTLEAPLILPEHGATVVQVAVGGDDGGRRGLTVWSRRADAPDAPWTRNATGVLGTGTAGTGTGTGTGTGFDVWPPEGAEAVDLGELYPARAGRLRIRRGLPGAARVWRRGDELFAEAALPESARASAGSFGIHPALLDAVLHVNLIELGDGEAVLPFSWSGVTLHAAGASVLRLRMTATGAEEVSLAVADGTGAPSPPSAASSPARLRRPTRGRRRGVAVPARPGAAAAPGAGRPGLRGGLRPRRPGPRGAGPLRPGRAHRRGARRGGPGGARRVRRRRPGGGTRPDRRHPRRHPRLARRRPVRPLPARGAHPRRRPQPRPAGRTGARRRVGEPRPLPPRRHRQHRRGRRRRAGLAAALPPASPRCGCATASCASRGWPAPSPAARPTGTPTAPY